MCSPAGGVIAAGTVMQAYSQYQAGKANARVAEGNAALADYQASDVARRGAQDASRVLAAGHQAGAATQVALGASGVDANVGSGAAAVTTSTINSEIDAARLRANAAREAWGYKQQASDLRAQARQERRGGWMRALGTGLGGFGSALSTYKGDEE